MVGHDGAILLLGVTAVLGDLLVVVEAVVEGSFGRYFVSFFKFGEDLEKGSGHLLVDVAVVVDHIAVPISMG